MIRFLTRADAERYRELRLQALQTDPEVFLSTFDHEVKRPLYEFEYELTGAGTKPGFGYYGLFNSTGEKLIGFCQCSPGYLAKQKHVAYLYNLYIDPESRHRGLAKNLLEHILKNLRASRIEVVVISHLAKNTAAHQLYSNLGFKEVGSRPKTVKWNDQYDDEIEMMLNL